MIVAEQKPINEILDMIKDLKKVLVVGCKGCVTVCNVGGEKEVSILATSIRIARKKQKKEVEVGEKVLERQCDPEYIEELKDIIDDYEGVISLACGVGPQFIAERFPEKLVFPAVNTKFIGGAIEHGVWAERCAGCGECVIHYYGGMCPIARCSKSLMNGPCGGSNHGKCEVSPEIDCIWDKIVRKLMAQGRLDDLLKIRPPKSWLTARDGGPRKMVREELAK